MMNILVCEDSPLYQQSIRQKIESWSRLTGHCDVEIHMFHSSETLLEQWERGLAAHIFFIDVQIPNEMSGIDLAAEIRKKDQEVPIVFVTNYAEYVYQGYTFNALRYLKKPVTEEDFYPCLHIAYRRYSLRSDQRLVLSLPKEKIVLRYIEILYIEAQSPDLYIHTLAFEKPIVIHYKLSKLLEMLPSTLFALCHRSYIVNVSQIRALRKTNVLISSGEELPVSNRCLSALHACFNQYHQKG
ncbi:MAG: LytTR family DNA-binding domain-containing protein [Clostridia bacterium]|nr:LytTR family DNA-binding domain-containing protein [Clostridia bacterium]